MSEQYETMTDPRPLMHELARMAHIPEGRFNRMVLVLEVGSIPTLYTAGRISEGGNLASAVPKGERLGSMEADVQLDDKGMLKSLAFEYPKDLTPEDVERLRKEWETTSQHNLQWRTFAPPPLPLNNVNFDFGLKEPQNIREAKLRKLQEEMERRHLIERTVEQCEPFVVDSPTIVEEPK